MDIMDSIREKYGLSVWDLIGGNLNTLPGFVAPVALFFAYGDMDERVAGLFSAYEEGTALIQPSTYINECKQVETNFNVN